MVKIEDRGWRFWLGCKIFPRPLPFRQTAFGINHSNTINERFWQQICWFSFRYNLLRMPTKPNKLPHPTGRKPIVMTTPSKKTVSPSAPEYPEKTTGSDAAASIRKPANDWSEQKRAELFEQGLRMIYGGSGPTTAKVRS